MTVLHSLLAATTSTTTSSSSKSSGSNYTFIIFAVVAVAFYFLIIRPRSQRQRQARTQSSTLDIGDAVMSVGGIKGVVVGMDDTEVQVEVSPGIVLTFIRRAVNPAPAPATPPDTEDEDEPAGVYHDEDGEQREIDPLDRPPGSIDHDEPDDRPGTGTAGN